MQHFNADTAGASSPEKSEAPSGANARGFRDQQSRQQDSTHAGAWSSSNLHGMSAEGMRDLAHIAAQTVAAHGEDPGTLEQAAAHEAAHVIVAHALGFRVLGARVWRNASRGRKRWEGCTRHVSPWGKGTTTAAKNPHIVLAEAANLLAGFCGEQLAGVSHPSSSIDERYKAATYAAALAAVDGVPVEFFAIRIEDYCLKALRSNRSAFDNVRSQLMRNKHRLTQDVAERMLARVPRETLE